jgi:hypothetical protein
MQNACSGSTAEKLAASKAYPLHPIKADIS